MASETFKSHFDQIDWSSWKSPLVVEEGKGGKKTYRVAGSEREKRSKGLVKVGKVTGY